MRCVRVLLCGVVAVSLACGVASVRAAEGPRFEPGPCDAFRVSTQGRTVVCGFVTVPESHAKPDGPAIRLAVVRFRAARATDAPPLVYLAGGPGGRGIGASFAGSRADLLATDRDFVVFDQRGVGYSEPNLECAEVRARSVTDPTLMLTDDERTSRRLAAIEACRDRLQARGIALAAYNSTESAADIADLRAALGYDRIDLLGISYGTRLALTTLRDFPAMVRSAVLDSTLPMQDDGETNRAVSFDRALRLLFADCAAATACNRDFPALQADLTAAVAQLNAAPLEITANRAPYRVDGTRLLSLIRQAMYTRAFIEQLPALIAQVRDGKTALLTSLYEAFSGGPSSSEGMGFSVECAELAAFSSPDKVRDAAGGLLPEVRDGQIPLVLRIFPVCDRWPHRAPDPRDQAPVVSDVPVLVLASENDPITPPVFGERAAATLAHVAVLRVPGIGHSVIGNGGTCATGLVLAFLRGPEGAPGASCAAQFGVAFRPR